MNHSPRPERLFTFDFIGLCLIIFLAYCNTTVFYSLDVYLKWLGIEHSVRGFLIGASALATIVSFLLFSPYMTTANAARNAVIGAATLILCGVSYLYARSVEELLAVRLAAGVGVYLLSAATMTLLVARIPPERSGQAFGIYSVAILLPYSAVPATFDALHKDMASLPSGYMAMSLFLAPAMAVVLVVGARVAKRAVKAETPRAMGSLEMYRNAARPPMLLLLLISTLYLTTFSSVFFMAKSFFMARNFSNVGSFFSIQMACMIVIRLFGSPIFDKVRKIRLTCLCFTLTAASCVLLARATDMRMVCLSAVVMGTGMGLGSPAMNSLMFSISEKRYQGVNTNLMAMSQQLGYFLGPMLGALAAKGLGYQGFLDMGAGACALALALCVVYARLDLDRGDPARGRK